MIQVILYFCIKVQIKKIRYSHTSDYKLEGADIKKGSDLLIASFKGTNILIY